MQLDFPLTAEHLKHFDSISARSRESRKYAKVVTKVEEKQKAASPPPLTTLTSVLPALPWPQADPAVPHAFDGMVVEEEVVVVDEAAARRGVAAERLRRKERFNSVVQ